MNQIEVTGTFRIPVPDDMKLVPAESHGYEGESLTGRWWTMKDLRRWCADKSVDWLKDNVLENPRYSRQIGEMERKGQIIHKGRGSSWKFKAKAMADYLLGRKIKKAPDWATESDKIDLDKWLQSNVPMGFQGMDLNDETKVKVRAFLEGVFWEDKQKHKDDKNK